MDIHRGRCSDKALRDKAFNIHKNTKYDRYQRSLSSMVYKFFNNKYPGSTVRCARSETLFTQNKYAIENKIISNEQLAEELHEPIVTKICKTKSALIFYGQYLGC